MRTGLFLTMQVVTDAELQEFVRDCGGEWHESHGIRQGVVQDRDSAVLITLSNEEIAFFEEEELRAVSSELGGMPGTAIVMALVRTEKSKPLAMKIANRLRSKWGGIIDWDDGAHD